jgi:hypothetical protein
MTLDTFRCRRGAQLSRARAAAVAAVVDASRASTARYFAATAGTFGSIVRAHIFAALSMTKIHLPSIVAGIRICPGS